jgi:hypothetical protein
MGLGSPTLNTTQTAVLDVNLAEINGSPVSLGQATMAASFPVVIASDQSPIFVEQFGVWSVGLASGSNVIGSLTANQSVNVTQIAGSGVQTAGANGVLAVGGLTSEGSAPGSNPLVIGMTDASGQVAYIESASAAAGGAANRLLGVGMLGWDYVSAYWRAKVDSSGKQYIATVDTLTSITNPVTVSGTVTANAGSGTFTIQSNASVNLAQVAGATIATVGSGIQTVGLSDGTNTANIIAGDSGQNAQVVSGARKEVTYSTTSVQAVAVTDVSNYAWVSVHNIVNGTNAVTNFQGSNDNTNWFPITLLPINAGSQAGQTSIAAANNILHGPLGVRYFRLNITGISAGTTSGTIEFFSNGRVLQTNGIGAAQTGTWSIGASSATGSAVPANAFYHGISDGTNLRGVIGAKDALNSTGNGVPTAQIVGQFDDVSPTAITENQFGNLRMSTNRNLYNTIRDAAGNERGANVDAVNNLGVNAGLMPSGTALNTYSVHLTSNTTTTPTSSTAYISSISISNEVGGTTSTITIQDKQGTPLKLINGLATTALTTAPTTINFQTPVKMVSGIDIITAGAVAATLDVWVNYYQ